MDVGELEVNNEWWPDTDAFLLAVDTACPNPVLVNFWSRLI
jgi:hypothetical protein